MSVKKSRTKADYMVWSEAKYLIKELYNDNKFVLAAFVSVSVYTGLKISYIKNLKWSDIINKETINVVNPKQNSYFSIVIDNELKKIISSCFNSLKINNIDNYIFLSQKKSVYSTQRLNVLLKEIKNKYNIHCNNMSCLSLRKTFGVHFLEIHSKDEDSEKGLITLSEFFGHGNTKITRNYLNLDGKHIDITKEVICL